MWFKVVVVGLKAVAGQKPKGTEAFCSCAVNASSAQVQDQSLSAFCWPLGPEHQSQKEYMAPEEFSFTLTQGDGSRLQGFCRRFLPPAPRLGSRLRYPQVLCLVCEVSWAALFFKVLEVTEQLLRQTDLLSDFSHKQLPADSLAGIFLHNLGDVLAQQPELGSVIRVQLPHVAFPLAMSPPKRIGGASTDEPLPLLLTEEFIELQVPSDAGNGTANAGISLARLLWHVPVPAMVTLIASLLLERRVLVVGQSRDMVSAAVLAAQALIHPFRWHHIFLPLLPRSLADYLTAPMPFLIGLPAQLLPAIKNLPMDEITLIDLDLGKCEPAPGSARDDAQMLPWREHLEGALQAALGLLKSPTEHESNPVIAGIMHGYFLKLLGNYRSHTYLEGTGPGFTPPQPAGPLMNGLGQLPPNGRASPGHQRSQSASTMHGSSSSSALAAFAAAAGGQDPRQSPRSTTSHGGAGSVSGSRRQSRASSSNIGPAVDEGMRAHGHWFDHSGLVASHRRNEKARNFLMLLRQSQLFEVFVRERLEMHATVEGGPELSGDTFEQLVNTYLDHRSKRLSARLGAGVRSSLSRFGALINKHHRAESTQITSSFGLSGSGFALEQLSASASGGIASSLRSGLSRGRSGGMSSSLAERPEALRMRQMVASFAAAAENMRRTLNDSNGSGRALTSLEGFAEKVVSAFDPSSLFGDDDEDIEAEAACISAAEAAANSGARLSRSSVSSSSLKDLVTGPLVAPSGASWTAGASSSSSRMGSLSTQSVHAAYAGASSSNSNAAATQQGGPSSPPLGRRSVPIRMQGTAPDRPVSPAPMIDLGGSGNSPPVQKFPGSGGSSSAAGHTGIHQQQQPHVQLPHHGYLEQLQMPPQQQQQQQLHSPASPRELQAQWQQPQHSPRGNRDSLIQQFMRPPLYSSGGGSRGSSSSQLQQHQQQPQHINVKAALAAIAPGPLPQPPQAKARWSAGGHALETVHNAGHSIQQPRPGMPGAHDRQPPQQQQQAASSVHAQAMPAAAATAAAPSSSGAAAATAAAGTWDPFAELLTERMSSFSGTAPAAPQHSHQQQQQQQQQQPAGVHSSALSLPGRGYSNASEGAPSPMSSTAGLAFAHVAGHSSSSDGSMSSSSDGGAAGSAVSCSTTPAGAVSGRGASVFGAALDLQQQQQLPLQQQPTMPESWLSTFANIGAGEGAVQGARQSNSGSCISFNGGACTTMAPTQTAAGIPAASVPEGGPTRLQEDLGLSQLKQAFAQQLLVQHSNAGDDLL